MCNKVASRAVYLGTLLTPQIDYLGTLQIVYENCSSEFLVGTIPLILFSLALPSGLSKPPSLSYKQNQLHVTVSHDFV